jgi:hypothetical protein
MSINKLTENELKDNTDEKYSMIAITVMIVIIFIGLVGNLLNLIVFSQKSMRIISTFHFLIYLSIIDIFVLSICSTSALLNYSFDFEIKLNANWLCRLHSFAANFFRHMASVVLMIVNIERAYLVRDKSPVEKKRTTISSNRFDSNLIINFIKSYRIDLIVVATAILLAFINLHYFLFFHLAEAENNNESLVFREKFNNHTFYNFSSLNRLSIKDLSNLNVTEISSTKNLNNKQKSQNLLPEKACIPKSKTVYTFFYMNIWSHFDTLIYSVIPFIVMIICSSLILIEVKSKTASFSSNLTGSTNRKLIAKRKRKNKQLLILLIITDVFFLVCSLPYCLNNNFNNFLDSNNRLTLFIYNIMAYSNNSFNFLFYGMFSSRYRAILASLFSFNNRRLSGMNFESSLRTPSKSSKSQHSQHQRQRRINIRRASKLVESHLRPDEIEINIIFEIRHENLSIEMINQISRHPSMIA